MRLAGAASSLFARDSVDIFSSRAGFGVTRTLTSPLLGARPIWGAGNVFVRPASTASEAAMEEDGTKKKPRTEAGESSLV
jgi:hypothetical protein